MKVEKPISAQYNLAVGAAAVALTVPTNTRKAYITVTTGTVRWRADGTNPTSGAGGGVLMPLGTTVIESGEILSKMKFIQESAAGALDVQYVSVE